MNNETSILKTKEEQIKAEKSYLGKDMDDLTVEELHQLNEDEVNYDCAKFSIGLVYTMKWRQVLDEEEKSQPDQALIDTLKNELRELHLERRFLGLKNRDEIKQTREHYSKIVRRDF